jgi:ribonuclease VapC
MSVRTAILDASALLAFLFDEPGAEPVAEVLDRASISTVNWVEVAQHSRDRGNDVLDARERLTKAGLQIVPLSVEDAEGAAELRGATRKLGLSLADLCCLAFARRTGLPVLTADSAWRDAESGAEVVLIR